MKEISPTPVLEGCWRVEKGWETSTFEKKRKRREKI